MIRALRDVGLQDLMVVLKADVAVWGGCGCHAVEGIGGDPGGDGAGGAGCVLKGSLAIRVRDELGPLFTEVEFADLFPARGEPAWSPGRLALVLVLQFVEGLTDRQAA
ncbi:hypothetical protein QFZ76_004022 [Streptomyces sp. V4I2]|nr:hypothetical protein [Streptomyces sp. V4I2]